MSKNIYRNLAQEIKISKFIRIGYSLQAFSIANAILWIGNFVYAITTGDSLIELSLLDFDISIILLYASFAQVVNNPQMLIFTVLGWIVASFWVKKDHPKEYSGIIVYSVVIPFMFLPAIILIFLLNIIIGTLQLEMLAIMMYVVLSLVILNFVALIVVIPGLILAGFFHPYTHEKSKMYSIRDYLVLFNPIPPSPNEKVVFCPFRMKNKPGCAYLGYKAPNQALICDYQSTWQSCYVYGHLFYKLKVLE